MALTLVQLEAERQAVKAAAHKRYWEQERVA